MEDESTAGQNSGNQFRNPRRAKPSAGELSPAEEYGIPAHVGGDILLVTKVLELLRALQVVVWIRGISLNPLRIVLYPLPVVPVHDGLSSRQSLVGLLTADEGVGEQVSGIESHVLAFQDRPEQLARLRKPTFGDKAMGIG